MPRCSFPNRALGYAPADSGGFQNSMSNWEQTGDGAVQLSIARCAQVGRELLPSARGRRQMVQRAAETRHARQRRHHQLRARTRSITIAGSPRAARWRLDRLPRGLLALSRSAHVGDHPLQLGRHLAHGARRQGERHRAREELHGEGAEQWPPAGDGTCTTRRKALDASRLVGELLCISTDEVVRIVRRTSRSCSEFVGRSFRSASRAPATYAVSGLPVTIEFVADGDAPRARCGSSWPRSCVQRRSDSRRRRRHAATLRQFAGATTARSSVSPGR